MPGAETEATFPEDDFHITVPDLRGLGLDHERVSYYHHGVNRRLADVHGHVIKEILA